jgi:hypothetical protein
MRHCLAILMGLFLGVVLCMPNTAYAQDKKVKLDRVSGVVQTISKDKNMITVRVKGTTTRTVIWDASTNWTRDNKPGSVNDLKEGLRAISLGKFNAQAQLMATRIELTEEKGR